MGRIISQIEILRVLELGEEDVGRDTSLCYPNSKRLTNLAAENIANPPHPKLKIDV
jgi:hypothetical protein